MMGKKLILAALAALFFLNAPAAEAETNVSATTTPFVDVTGHWAEKQITELYISGVIQAPEDGRFRPYDMITRGELITLFLRAKGINPHPGNSSPFADVPSDSWLSPYAETAYRLGIIHGQKIKGKLYMNPSEQVEREELVSMLLRAKGESGRVNQLRWSTTIKSLHQYPDGGSVEEVFQRPFVYALQKGFVSPYSDGSLQPRKAMTRAEAAVYARLHLLADQTGKPTLPGIDTPYRKMLSVQTTAYSYPTDEIKSFLEFPLRKGVVAVDPQVIPLGTHLYIEGYGYAVAADIGGAVKQKHVDVFLPSLQAAYAYGRQKDTKVYILD
jgi:3D (Asp-Asp-Asp) domain-containing protein